MGSINANGKEELVSIILPSYNTEKYIADAIESVLSQTYNNWEMIIVDDGSTDNSIQIIDEYVRRDKRIRLIKSDKNCGLPSARNKAIKVAKGRYIAFLDSDDMWLPEKLEKQINFMKANRAVLTFTAYRKIDENGNIISKVLNVPETVTYEQLLRTCVIGVLTAIYDTRILGKLYMNLINQSEDYCLWLKILKMGHVAHGLNRCLALYRIRKKRMSRNKFIKAIYQWRIYRQREALSFFKSIYCMINYAYYGFKKLII